MVRLRMFHTPHSVSCVADTAPFRCKSTLQAHIAWWGETFASLSNHTAPNVLTCSPPVPPKPPHLQSPVTELLSPLGSHRKPELGPSMEEGGGGDRGGRGGGRGAANRENAREKHSKVSDLISRFEENRYGLFTGWFCACWFTSTEKTAELVHVLNCSFHPVPVCCVILSSKSGWCITCEPTKIYLEAMDMLPSTGGWMYLSTLLHSCRNKTAVVINMTENFFIYHLCQHFLCQLFHGWKAEVSLDQSLQPESLIVRQTRAIDRASQD